MLGSAKTELQTPLCNLSAVRQDETDSGRDMIALADVTSASSKTLREILSSSLRAVGPTGPSCAAASRGHCIERCRKASRTTSAAESGFFPSAVSLVSVIASHPPPCMPDRMATSELAGCGGSDIRDGIANEPSIRGLRCFLQNATALSIAAWEFKGPSTALRASRSTTSPSHVAMMFSMFCTALRLSIFAKTSADDMPSGVCLWISPRASSIVAVRCACGNTNTSTHDTPANVAMSTRSAAGNSSLS
mmetsp:Transcript_27119/g.68036  ORF Transcript_27119/g.68036 Transcript_27119/m.68036 type:complete len:248 (-) Transcript_27119:226-969(-)